MLFLHLMLQSWNRCLSLSSCLQSQTNPVAGLCFFNLVWFSIKIKLRNKEMGGDAKVFAFEDVTVHNKSKDCWLIINGKVRSFIEFS